MYHLNHPAGNMSGAARAAMIQWWNAEPARLNGTKKQAELIR
jgi:hypothetical protein